MANQEEVILKLIADVSDVKKELETVKKSTKETGKEAKEAANNFSIMGVSINSVKSAFSKVIPIAKSMFGTIKAGLISTGIGAFVVVIGSLISYFTNTKKGAEQLQVAFKAVGATIAVITDRISSLGSAIVKVFKGDFKGAAEDAKAAVTGLGAEIVKETKAMIELTQTLQRVRDAERDFSKERAKTNQEIAKARLLAEDETASYEKRLEALKTANELEIQTTEKAIKLQKEKLEAKRIEIEQSKSMAEDLDELASLEVELINMQTTSFMTRKRLMTAEETLRREFQAKKNADAKEEADRIKAEEAEKENSRKEQEKIRLESEKARSEYEKEQSKIRLEAAKAEEELAIKVQKSKLDASLQTLEGIKGVFGEESAAGKAAAVVQSTINTYQGITAALASSPPPFNIALAGITAAAGFKNVTSILSTPEPQFAQGGMVSGYGTGSSDSVSARLSKGESVINARSTRMFKPLLSAINEAGGGRSFASGEGAGGTTMGVVKAFVVADDMTKQQDKLSKIRRKATI